ncbi:hypothetical protein M378DRAFT_456014 [Amanita muscaria Koide BX008]|uniref:Uncharacterized protein n=1 Tax=Amanita muscaria (strain Koide BX008) TaxID=946122 RepID=A0A0C2SRL0_AMAMK|nr:hypothetical protein M378DRAFT_456014 [Amanita muscaria Koide BX008]
MISKNNQYRKIGALNETENGSSGQQLCWRTVSFANFQVVVRTAARHGSRLIFYPLCPDMIQPLGSNPRFCRDGKYLLQSYVTSFRVVLTIKKSNAVQLIATKHTTLNSFHLNISASQTSHASQPYSSKHWPGIKSQKTFSSRSTAVTQEQEI